VYFEGAASPDLSNHKRRAGGVCYQARPDDGSASYYTEKARKPLALVNGCPQKNSDFSGTLEKSLLFHANGSGFFVN